MIQLGATAAMAVSLLVHIAGKKSLTLDQMREGARLLACHTAKQEHHTLTAETTITLGQYRQAVGFSADHKHSTQPSLVI